MIRKLPVVRTVLVALIALTLFAASPALAQWRVQEGIDIASGGPSLLLIGEINDQTTFYANCIGGETRLFIATFDGKDEGLDGSGLLNLGISLDQLNASLWWTSGQQTRRPSFLTANFTDPAVFERVLNDIAAAKQSITFSVYVQDTRTMSDLTISASGSTAAVRQYQALCAAQSPESSPAPAQPQPQQAPPPASEPAPEPEPQQPPAEQAPTQSGGWTFAPGNQPELASPVSNDMQFVIICVARGVSIILIESTDLEGFPSFRSSADGVAVFGFDQVEPLTVSVAPGQARPGVVGAVAEDPPAALAVTELLAAEPPFKEVALLMANRNSDARKLGVYNMTGAASTAASFRAACYN